MELRVFNGGKEHVGKFPDNYDGFYLYVRPGSVGNGDICSLSVYKDNLCLCIDFYKVFTIKISPINLTNTCRFFTFGNLGIINYPKLPEGIGGCKYGEYLYSAGGSSIETVKPYDENQQPVLIVRGERVSRFINRISLEEKEELDAAIIQHPRVAETIDFVLEEFERRFPGITEFFKNNKNFKKMCELCEREVSPEVKEQVDELFKLYGVIQPSLDLPKGDLTREKKPEQSKA